jgi:hypothetical protein
MLGWLKGLFDQVGKVVVPWLMGIFDLLRSFVWMWVALLLAILAPIYWAIDWFARSAAFVAQTTADMLTSTRTVNPAAASSYWAPLLDGAALMNCVVALDYAIALGSVVISMWGMIAITRGLVWLYKLLPGKFT